MSAATLPAGDALRIARAFLPARWYGNRYHYYYTRAKLRSDPLYPGVIDALRATTRPVLDLGCGIDRRVEFVGGPAGRRDDPRVAQADLFFAQRTCKLHRPAQGGLDAFADRVTVAEREVPHAGELAHQATALWRSRTFSARRSSTRSMRANTSRRTGASGSSVTRK